MGQQTTFALAAGFEKHQRQTRRGAFLEAMNVVVPWGELCAEIEPFYPKPGNGRPPVGLERMLRIYFLQAWFNLSDPGVEEALYESFRHLLERHGLGKRMFERVNGYLAGHGFKIGTGTIVDATLIAAPSSTKNQTGERDPEMHQVKKGNEWYFGMKAHVGVDAETKLIHSVATTAANVADSRMLAALLHGEETAVWGDQAYQGQAAVLAEHAPKAEDRTHRRWRTKLREYPEVREANRIRSKTRSRVEHVFAVLKLRFGFVKVRYRGLAKNANRLFATCALVNLVTAQKHLLAVSRQ